MFFIFAIYFFYIGVAMDLRNLATFIQVAESKSFSRAADMLGYSQPTVSFQIKQLEGELNSKLFDRIGHTVSLTDEGKRLLGYAQRICRLADEMASGEDNSDNLSGLIHIAMASSLCNPLVLERFTAFHKLHPNISVKVTMAGTDEMFRLLDHNEVDIVCTLDSHIYDSSYVISKEEQSGVHFVCATDDPLTNRKDLSISDLVNEPFLLTEKGMSYRRLMDEAFSRISVEIKPILELGDADIICKLVAEGTGISFLPDYVTEKAVKLGKIRRLDVSDCNIELWKQQIYHRNKWVSPAMKAVIDYLSEITL